MAISDIALDWSCDCDLQSGLMDQNISDINTFSGDLLDVLRPRIDLYLPYLPSQGNWESEWIKRGNTLPIPDGADLLWYDTNNDQFGGNYTVISGVVYPVGYKYAPGSVFSITQSSGTPTNENTALGADFSATIATISFGTLVSPGVPCKLSFFVPVYTAGQIRWNYTLAGVTQYNVEFGVAGAANGYGDFTGGTAFTNWIPNFIHWDHYTTFPLVNTAVDVRFCCPSGTGGVRFANHQASYAASAGFASPTLRTFAYAMLTII